MRVLVFGTGYIYEQYKHRLADFNVVALVDNDVAKQGKMKDNIPIILPEKIFDYSFDAIIIMSVYYPEIRDQLEKLGIASNKIIDEKHLGVFSGLNIKHEYIVNLKTEGKKILLVSNELTNTGAPTVLLNWAKILIKNGYAVDLISCRKGPILYDYLDAGVNVFIYEWTDMIPDDFMSGYNLVILNTILVNSFAERLANKTIPVLWWIHEDKPSFEFFGIKPSDISVAMNIHPIAVSKRVLRAYYEYTGSKAIEELNYGLELHTCNNRNRKADGKKICAIIGYVNEVKGQDLLLKAIDINESQWSDRVEFWIIGSISDENRVLFESKSCVKVWGNLDHKMLMDLFSEIDIVLCTSRHESLPAAILEGMMHEKVCITSSETGIVDYCDPFKDVLVFKNEDISDISDKLNWVLSHWDDCEDIARNGYLVFNNIFRMEYFEKNAMKLIDKYIC